MINPKTLRENLATRLRVQLPTAKVFEYPPGDLADRRFPTVFLSAIRDVAVADSSLIGDSEAIYQIEGAGYATSGGATDDQWEKAEALAYALIDGVVAVLEADETIGGAANHARVTNWTLEPTQDESNVFFALTFTVTAWFYP